MKVHVIGCSHHNTSVQLRERLAFTPEQAADALEHLRATFPSTEAVLLSTCNRVELYTASESDDESPTHSQLVEFMARYHGLKADEVFEALFDRTGEDAVRHLFTVAASLDSMVVGEPQILSQVKQAFALAKQQQSTGPLTHSIFQDSLRVAKRVATETAINEKRVSIPSVAVCEYATGIFETFADKRVLVIGAGEMAEETLQYLKDEGADQIHIVNRSHQRAQKLAAAWHGEAAPWESLPDELIRADLVVSATGATEPIVTLDDYHRIEHDRYQRTLLVLDLAIPRDFDPRIGDCLGVYLCSVDDLKSVCERNRREREKERIKAMAIIDEETDRFMAELNHRATGPIIRRLRETWHEVKDEELARLFRKLSQLDDRSRREISQSMDRLINKLLHPPLHSLRDESKSGSPHGLLDALKRLFRMED